MLPKFSQETLENLRSRLAEYLAKAGLEFRKNGTRLVAKCPVHDDRSPSFTVFGDRLENCGCYPCDFTGDVFDASQWLGRSSSFLDAVAEVAATLGVHLEGLSSSSAKASPRLARKPAAPFVLSPSDREKIHAARLAFSDAYDAGELDELSAGLGIPLASLKWCARGKSGLGWWDGRLAYIYPQGLKVRNAAGLKPRFLWICGRALAPWRFEWVNSETRTIFITEGESDCMALVAAGLESDGTAACVASPGTSFPREWGELFAGKRVVICFDRDAPGVAAAAKVAGLLRSHATQVLAWKGIPVHV